MRLIATLACLPAIMAIPISGENDERSRSSSSTCTTISGPAQGADCVFPFISQNITFFGCTTLFESDDEPKAWCSTKTDANGKHVPHIGAWGYCEPSCPNQGSSSNDVCQYTCLEGGVCEVQYIGLPRGGNTKGSCFPERFGGGCSGTPPECQECNRIKNCENSPEPELDKCPLSGRFPNTDVVCLNEDGTMNCQQDSDCWEGNCVEGLCTVFEEKEVEGGCSSSTEVCEERWETVFKESSPGVQEISQVRHMECNATPCQFLAIVPRLVTSTSGQIYSGLGGIGQISNRCPKTQPCPYPSGKCGRMVGLGLGGKIPACPRRRF